MQPNSQNLERGEDFRVRELLGYRREICSIKQMTKIFVFLDKDWEDRGTGPVYFILKHRGKYHKLNDYDLDRLHFNWDHFSKRQQQMASEEKQRAEKPEAEPGSGGEVRGKNLAVLSSHIKDAEPPITKAGEPPLFEQSERKEGDDMDGNFLEGQEYSLKIQSDPEDKLYNAYLEGDQTRELVEESGFVYVEPHLAEEVERLNSLGLGIHFESSQVKPREGELFILILKSDDNNLPKRPDSDLNEVLKGELQENDDILMWYSLSQIYTMDAPYNNIIEWQHKNPDQLKLAISFLSLAKCEESYHAIIKNVGIKSDNILSPIEPGCNLSKKLLDMKSDSVELENIKSAYMESGSRYMRGLHREFCLSMFYRSYKRLEELGEIFKFFVFLSDMDIMTNMISDENHLMFFTCLNYLTENKNKNLDFEQFFRKKAAMINVLNIKKEEIIVVINNRFRLIFLKDFVFSVSLNEEILQHYNIFLIMNGTTVISYLIESMDVLFSNLDELITRNVDQMTNFFGEFFGTIKHHFIQFEELKIKFSNQMMVLGMWKKLSALILRNLGQMEKLSQYLDSAISLENSYKPTSKSKFSEVEFSNEPEQRATLEKMRIASEKKVNIEKDKLNESAQMNMASSFISVVSEVKSVRGEEKMEVDITRSVRNDRRRNSRVKFRNREYLEDRIQKIRKKVLLCLEVLSFIIKHNKQSAHQIFLEPVYKGKCLADGIFELASFPFLSIRETFAEMFNFFIHYMDNKENFIFFLFEQLYPHMQKVLQKHKHKFEYFKEDGMEKYIEHRSSLNQIQEIKRDQQQSKEPYQQQLGTKPKKINEHMVKEMYREGLKKLSYRQYNEGPAFSGARKVNLFREKCLEESAKSQEDFDRKSLRVEESLMSEMRSDMESLRKRDLNEFRGSERFDKKRDGFVDRRRFERTKTSFEYFLSFYLGLHDVMDKIGTNENKYWERKELLFEDCRQGFLLIEKKSIQIYFLKVLHEAVNKETFKASLTLFDETLFKKLLELVHENYRKNSMLTCILRGIFQGIGLPSFNKISSILVKVFEDLLKEKGESNFKIWREIKAVINIKKKEILIMKNQEKLKQNPIQSMTNPATEKQANPRNSETVFGRFDCLSKEGFQSIGKRAPKISESLIEDDYYKENLFSDEDKVDDQLQMKSFASGMDFFKDRDEQNEEFEGQINKQLFEAVPESKTESNFVENGQPEEANHDEFKLINLKKIESIVKLNNKNNNPEDKEGDPEKIQQIKLE